MESLPSPLYRGQGWPWESDYPKISALQPATLQVSVITCCLNQGRHLEQAIRSVLLQGYHQLEYVIVDRGSSDDTRRVISHYRRFCAHVLFADGSSPAAAINRALRCCNGQVFGLLNADNYYLPGALETVAGALNQLPFTDLLYGRCVLVDEAGNTQGEHAGSIQGLEDILDLWRIWWQRGRFLQPEVFWTKRVVDRIGFFDENYRFAMDFDYWVRVLYEGAQAFALDLPLAAARPSAPATRAEAEAAARELLAIVGRYLWDRDSVLPWWRRFGLQGRWRLQEKLAEQLPGEKITCSDRLKRWGDLGWIFFRHPETLFQLNLRYRHRYWRP